MSGYTTKKFDIGTGVVHGERTVLIGYYLREVAEKFCDILNDETAALRQQLDEKDARIAALEVACRE